jgi:DNA-binding MarR family transcriptional regulator/N-acetylglutamate synthase-like GNAT family acetyltransferase
MADLVPRIAAIRRFNRFYTHRIGALNEGLLQSRFSLAEVRVLYELAHRTDPTAAELGRDLAMDGGYLSRLLRGLARRGLVGRRACRADGRRRHLRLTEAGRRAFQRLDTRASEEIRALLAPLASGDQRRLVGAMETVEAVLRAEPRERLPYLLRPPRPGELGWVVERHGALYAEEFGWDERFEGLVAGVVAEFVRGFDRRRERCWIVEREGEPVGSVFLVRGSDTVARLRLLLVEPNARGLGIGKRLVEECIRFAREAGYRRVSLWTNSVLVAARHIYEATGFRLTEEEPHQLFGSGLVGQTWELEL